jgi:hypothetical protein
MNTFNITIKFDLRGDNMSMDNIDDLLFEGGFDDDFC